MTDKVAELEARIAELEAAIQWANIFMPDGDHRAELRARAFPPKFEEVEVKEWRIKALPGVTPNLCAKYPYDVEQSWVPEGHVQVEMTGHYQRPIVAKVKTLAEQIEDAQKEAHSANAKLQSLLLEKQLNAITAAHEYSKDSKLSFP